MNMKIFLTNLGEYNEGYLIGKWGRNGSNRQKRGFLNQTVRFRYAREKEYHGATQHIVSVPW